jgi:hypothetical protein
LEGGATAAAEARLRPSARHVLGVAFPYTDAGEARGFELECSFLQLAYSVCRLRSGRYDAVGYFAMLSQELRDAVSRLKARYQVGDAVHIVFTSLLISDMTTLAEASERALAEGDPSILVTVGRQIAPTRCAGRLRCGNPTLWSVRGRTLHSAFRGTITGWSAGRPANPRWTDGDSLGQTDRSFVIP